jgi:thioester reductase-like protein
VGQISGGPNGAWNTTEWFPALLKSSLSIRCLPGGEDVSHFVIGHVVFIHLYIHQLVSWTPADIAAATIIDFRLSTEQTLHLNHPKPVKWSSVIDPIADALSVPIVSYREWLSKLEETGREVDRGHTVALDNPALKLMDFYRVRTITDGSKGPREALGFPILNLSKALQISSTLHSSNLQQMGKEDVEKWIQYWKSKGFL